MAAMFATAERPIHARPARLGRRALRLRCRPAADQAVRPVERPNRLQVRHRQPLDAPARLALVVMLLAADALESLLGLLDRLGLARGGCPRLNWPSLPVPRRSPPRKTLEGCREQAKGRVRDHAGWAWPRRQRGPVPMKGFGRRAGYRRTRGGHVGSATASRTWCRRYDANNNLAASSGTFLIAYGNVLKAPTRGPGGNGPSDSTNDLYSVYALTDGAGTVVERYMYDPYGKVTILDGNGTPRTVNESLYGNPWTFTGRRLDGETGLMYYRNRMYSVDLGRFLQRDPIGYRGGINLYEYVNGYPSFAMDPLGTDPDTIKPKPNDGQLAPDHLYVSTEAEKEAGVYDTKCTTPCVPISITLTQKGNKPVVGRYKGMASGRVFTTPWKGLGKLTGDVVGGQVGGGHITIEWVITFNTDPRACSWGRNITERWRKEDPIFGKGLQVSQGTIRDDSDHANDYIIGNKVYMYDFPGTMMMGAIRRLFNVWAKAEPPNKKRIDAWYYANTGEEVFEIDAPYVYEPTQDLFPGLGF